MTQKKVLALLLTLCLVFSMTVPAYAAGSRSSSWPWTSSSAAAKEEPASTSSGSLVLVEDDTTVTEGTELRASTYVLTNDGSASSASADVYIEVDTSMTASELAKAAEEGETFYYLSNGVYYEVAIAKSTIGAFIKRTFYTLTANNVRIATLYGTSKLSSARVTLYTKEAAVSAAALTADATGYGLNNSGASTYAGEPDSTTTLKYFPVTLYNYNTTTINNATHQVEVDNGLGSTWNGIYFNDGNPSAEVYTYSTGGEVSYTRTTVRYSKKNNYNEYINNGYYVDVNGTKYLVTGLSCKKEEFLFWTTYSWTISYAGGTATSSDSSITLYKASTSSTATTASLPYADWNFWKKGASNGNEYGQYTYSGLVESTLTANKDITFTKPDGGIFNSDATVKDIYTGVEMPFVYEKDTGTYTFDASQNGAFFHEDTTQGSTGAKSNGRLYFYENSAQTASGMYFGDGSSTVWAPFDDTTVKTLNYSNNSITNMDYYFGMRTTIPFTMTANGKMNPNDNNSADITFSFSGDDDVWVFIDGQLVIDLGGIHNRLDATINFAKNTWSISESNNSTVEVADYNHAAISGALFNDGESTGTLNQTRETFAATDSHELTIFYLERGAGSSNCKIQFNLPMKDSVSVKKLVRDTDSAGEPLDAETLAQINNRDFHFTLYKDGAVVANTNYSLLNENGQYVSTPSTDANGHFTLKNGQTAKFVGEISSNKDNPNSYYVVEDKDEGAEAFWQVPDWTCTTDVANGVTRTESTIDGQSMTVTATGSTESEDSIVFTCTNIWVHQDKTSISAVDDKIVIDYGLPVVIDVLANDTVSSGTKSIESVSEAQYGTATIVDGKITYQLTKQLTGVEVLTYTAKATATSGVESDNKTATAKVYIIPATSMYYEENFGNLVTYTDNNNVATWTSEGTAQTDPQEPGVVGTVGDSPYGSDAAYLNDSGDSNGSSKYVNTTDGSATFSYTFTGTGTSFFARTSGSTAVISIKVTDVNGNQVAYQNRNTIYTSVEGTDVDTLYNIPVYTNDGLDYGTYTVTVTVLKAVSGLNYGSEFYLDGIRVINPLNSTDANASVANAAYATDGEANMAVVTLRQKLIDEAQINEDDTISWNEGDNFVLFTDTNGKIKSAEVYKSNGPKEEVYLNNGQSVTFALAEWDPNTNKIYLGIKAPVGSGTVSVNGNTLNIHNVTDCYYDISGYANITTGEDGVKTATFEIKATGSLISVTNIKVTGNAKFIIVNKKDIEVGGSEGGNGGEGEDQEITDGGAE